MVKKSLIALLLWSCCTFHFAALGQDLAALFRQAQTFEKAFKDESALDKYLEVLRHDPRNIVALCRVSELYNVIGKRLPEKDKQKQYFQKGLEYARQAVKLKPDNSEAHFVMAISLGRTALISSGDEKINAVKDIKLHADRCVQLDPDNYKGYHVLAKWHYEVSDLSGLERWLVKVTYGALPAASIDESIKNYEKSRQLAPAFLLNYLELAKAYKRKNDKKKARILLEQLQKMPNSSSDDPKIKSLGRKLLADL